MLEELEAAITLTVEEELITSACHQIHSTRSPIKMECRAVPMCMELNMNTLYKVVTTTMSPVLSVLLQHVGQY